MGKTRNDFDSYSLEDPKGQQENTSTFKKDRDFFIKKVKKVIDYIKPTCFRKFRDFFAGRKLNIKNIFEMQINTHKTKLLKKEFKRKYNEGIINTREMQFSTRENALLHFRTPFFIYGSGAEFHTD